MCAALRSCTSFATISLRTLVTTAVKNDVPAAQKAPTSAPPSADRGVGKMTPELSNLHKRMLVFSGKYKSFKDVPNSVTVEVLERSRSRARIRLSNYLMLLTLVGCLSFAYSGKKAAERGESVQKMNLDWHKDYNALLDSEEKAKAAKQK